MKVDLRRDMSGRAAEAGSSLESSVEMATRRMLARDSG